MDNELVFPLLLLALLGAAAWKRLPAYDLFVCGAKQGLGVAVQVLPNLAGMLCALSLMEASGLTAALCGLAAPALGLLGLPPEVTPLLLLRPMSGSASLGLVESLMERFGPDSQVGLIACTLMGAGETIFYTVCVYMSATEERRTGYAVPCALLGALAGAWLAGRLFS